MRILVGLLLILIGTVAHAADASFKCVTKTSYSLLDSDRPMQYESPASQMMANNSVDVLVHDGKALVTTTLFGGTQTREFQILQVGGKENGWRLAWYYKGPAADPTVIIDIRTWGIKDVSAPLRMSVYYSGDIALGTCTRVNG